MSSLSSPEAVAGVALKLQRPVFRKLANIATDIREGGNHILAAAIKEKGPGFRSWKMAGVATALLATDVVDGWLGRRSNIPDPNYVIKDEQTDKELYGNVMEAIGIATGNGLYFGYIAVNEHRNAIVEEKREQLREYKLQSGARNLGKLKTVIQSAGIVLDLSPIGDKAPLLVHSVHMASLAATVVSGVDIVLDANHQLAEHNSQQQFDPVAEII